MRILQNLPEKQRLALVWHLYYDYSLEEIAQELQVPSSTVRSWFRRGLRSMKEILIYKLPNEEIIEILNHSFTGDE